MTQIALDQPIALGRTAEIYRWGKGQILKLYVDWVQLSWVEEEAAATRAVYSAGLPVPSCEQIVELNGRYGIIFEQISGCTMLESLNQKPQKLFPLMSVLARLHTQLHAASVPQLPSQHEAIKRSLQHAPFLKEEQKEALLAELDQLPAGDRVCHNDFHPDNVIISDRGPIIIDWMTAKRGNPLADVARTALLINNGAPIGDIPNRRFLMAARRIAYGWYLLQYARLGHFDSDQYQHWLPIMAAARLNENIPGEQDWLMRLIKTNLERVHSQHHNPVQSR
jgi:uncharacterized protein (TIGR02172 family)